MTIREGKVGRQKGKAEVKTLKLKAVRTRVSRKINEVRVL